RRHDRAGRAAGGKRRHLDRGRSDHLRLQLVPLRHGRRPLPLDPRRDEADVGHTLGFVVRATDSAGTTTQYADLVGPVAAAGAALASTAQPLVTGTAGPGRTLQVTTGTWSQLPSGLAYQWLRCNPNGHLCVPIAGATATSYVVGAADSGHALLATVTSSVGAVQQPALSTRTPVVP